MFRGIFDTHAHYDDARFDTARREILEGQLERGVALILNCGSDLESSERSVRLAEEFPFVYAAVGVHPHEAGSVPEDWLDRLAVLAAHPKVVSIGEIGLDYYYEHSDRETQKRVFSQQLELAERLRLPVEIHDRDAHGDLMDLLRQYRPKGVIHRYSGSPEMAREITAIGLYLGIGCAVTYKNSKKEQETVRQMPLEKLLLETDCPYLAPAHLRRETCTSDMIAFAAEKIAQLRGDCTAQQVIDIARENGKKLFGIA